MKRIIIFAAAAALALTFAFGVCAAGLFTASSETIHANTNDETVRMVFRANNAVLTSCGFKYEPVEGFEFVSGSWLFDEDGDNAPFIMQDMEQGEKTEPAVCAFSGPTSVDGEIFELILKPTSAAKDQTEIEVMVSYSEADMINKRETLKVNVVILMDGEEFCEGEEDSGSGAVSQNGSEPVSAPEESGRSAVLWIIIAVVAAAVIGAVCAVVLLRKKK